MTRWSRLPERRQTLAVRAAAALGLGAAAVAAAALAQAIHGAVRVQRALTNAGSSRPFQMQPVRVAARLLIVGDSTAVGIGATSLRSGLAGLIARDHPGAMIVNRATAGADATALRTQLEGTERFDVILVLAGGTDLLRLRPLGGVRRALQAALLAARERAGTVVLMPTPLPANLPSGLGGSVGWPWSWLADRRALALQRQAAQLAAQTGALHVDVSDTLARAAGRQIDGRLVAADGLHPNDACYALWYDQLKTQVRFSALLTRSHRQAQQEMASSWSSARGS